MPSVLIELGFISNSKELNYMEKETGRTQLAESILKAFSEYKLRFDERNSSNQQQPVVAEEPKIIQADSLIDVSALKGKWYGIQIMAIKNKLDANDPYFKGQSPVCFLIENGMYKYFLGLTQDYNEFLKRTVKLSQFLRIVF